MPSIRFTLGIEDSIDMYNSHTIDTEIQDTILHIGSTHTEKYININSNHVDWIKYN